MQHVQETNLAWSLIEAAKPQLNVRERQHVFVSVGGGDSFTAIRILLKLIAVKDICLHPHLVQLCTTWLDAYALHEDYECLRLLIEGFTRPVTTRQPLAIGSSPISMRQPAALVISGVAYERGCCVPTRAS
jgi:hypothetical protein